MKKRYDYLIVGAGLFGATFAYEAKKRNKNCLIIDKRNHYGGNLYCENLEGINVHKYGPHIFHTSNKEVWDFVNRLVEFNRFTNVPMAKFDGKLYNLPFNMNTFHQLWGVITPAEAKAIIEQQAAKEEILEPRNLEEQALKLVGRDIYEKLIKGYTEKQWGRSAADIPAFIIRRIPLRFNFDNNYFNDNYQGIPIGGYNVLIEKLIDGIETKLNVDFFKEKAYFESLANKILYTGEIDRYFNYEFGSLEYRSLKFENEFLPISNFQGNAIINYTEREVPFTRIIEHKHFEFGDQANTVITKEYPMNWVKGDEPFYPINDDRNNKIANNYFEKASSISNLLLGGRLAEYKYYDMHHIIERVFNLVKTEFGI